MTKTLLVLGICLALLSGCSQQKEAETAPPDQEAPLSDRASADTGLGQAVKLDRAVAMEFYSPVSIRHDIFPALAAAVFGGRLKIDPSIDGEVEGKLPAETLRGILDYLCEVGGCVWEVAGNPPALVVTPAKEKNHVEDS